MLDSLRGLDAVLFDFGGTLDGPGVPWIDRFAAAYRAAKMQVSPDRLREAFGFGTRQAYQTPHVSRLDLRGTVAFHVECQFARLGIEDRRATDAIVATFVSWTTDALAESRAVLARLGRRFALGVVSNYYGNVDRVLADAGIAPLLAAIVDSTVVRVSKPDPAIFRLALRRLGVEPGAALFVGDSLANDIVPARTAGLRTAQLVRADDGDTGSAADVRVRTLVDLECALVG